MLQKILAASLVLGVGGYILFKEKQKSAINQMQYIKFEPLGLRNLDAKLNDFEPQLSFNVDLKVKNPMNVDFTINGLVVKLQRVIILDKNNRAVGVAMPNMSQIRVPAFSYSIIKNVPVVIDLKIALANIFNWRNIKATDFKYVGIINVLGLEYKINN